MAQLPQSIAYVAKLKAGRGPKRVGLNIRMLPQQRAQIEALAEAADMTVQAYCLRRLLPGEPPAAKAGMVLDFNPDRRSVEVE